MGVLAAWIDVDVGATAAEWDFWPFWGDGAIPKRMSSGSGAACWGAADTTTVSSSKLSFVFVFVGVVQ